jgi:acyl-coenzyme A thioesterase PaaI-like protein
VLLPPNPTNGCFVCGGANRKGLQLTFEQDDTAQRIRGRFRISAQYQGATGYLHGGMIATLLDEVMAKVSRFRKEHAVTAGLTVEYRKPVPVEDELIVEGWETGCQGRRRSREGEIRTVSGVVLARGQAQFVVIDPAQFQRPSRSA